MPRSSSSKKKIVKPMGICSFCMGDEEKNADGLPEDMIHCAECGNSGHPSCLHYSKKLIEKIKTIRWQCLDCKRCVICDKADDSLIFCDLCDAAIHPKCSTPPLHHVPKGEFVCQSCRKETKTKTKISRPVAQLIDGMSKFFLPKQKTNHQRQQSVQKAMNYLRKNDRKRTLARRILSASKSERIRRGSTRNSSQTISTSVRTSNKRKENELIDEDETKVTKRKFHLDLSKYKNPPSFLHDSLPDNLTNNDVYQFLDAKTNSAKLISDCSEQYFVAKEEFDNNNDPNNIRWPPFIVFGGELIKTWYSSSYPQEYARVPRLFICEFCLKYMKCEEVYDRHRKNCKTFHPPANEIYHKDHLSVFEVDGNINRIYCQNLCLLAKLFLDHKTLYYDVEPFLFYVLTRNDASGCHFLGYFSKEKHCPQKYNLSCIMVLPHCQRRGYGRFLIELSYILSEKENQIGTPERPLSTHGAQTYETFWKLKIARHLLKYFHQKKEKCLLKTLMDETAMTAEDIFDTLQNFGMLTMKTNGNLIIHADVQTLETMIENEKVKHSHWVSFDEEFLRFTPVLKPFLFVTPDDQYDQTNKDIEIVFKPIENDSLQPIKTPEESTETSTEPVRIVRRRKFGRKRRSIYVKYRVPTKNPSINVNDDDDEHSQEYVSRRRTISINELTKDEDENTSSSVSIPQCEPLPEVILNSKAETNQNIPEIDDHHHHHQSTKHLSASESDLRTLTNGNQSESNSTTNLSEDQPKKIYNSPLPFKKRAWVSTNLDALIDLPKNDSHLANGNTSPPNNRSTYSTRSSVARQQQQQTTMIPADHIQSILDNFGQILPSISDSTSSNRRH